MEKNKRMQFYGGTLGACAPLLVFMCLMIVIAAMKKVSLVLFCMAGFAGLCVAFLLAKDKKEFEQAVVDGLKNDTLCVIIFAFLLAGILSQELRQSGLIQGLTWLVMKLGLSAGFLPLVGVSRLPADLDGLRHVQRRHCRRAAGAAARRGVRRRESLRRGRCHRQRRDLRR